MEIKDLENEEEKDIFNSSLQIMTFLMSILDVRLKGAIKILLHKIFGVHFILWLAFKI